MIDIQNMLDPLLSLHSFLPYHPPSTRPLAGSTNRFRTFGVLAVAPSLDAALAVTPGEGRVAARALLTDGGEVGG